MKLQYGIFTLFFLCTGSSAAEPRFDLPGGEPHVDLPDEQDVESPKFIVTASPTAVPIPSPTPLPTSARTIPPTTSPLSPSTSSDVPSTSPAASPSEPSKSPASPPGCTTTSGFFGDVDQEVFRTIEFGYELEASATATEIENDIIPLVEVAVTDSILEAVFPECSNFAIRRMLRNSRRLDVTGVTLNPDDLILDDVVCGSVEDGNECVVVSGALSVYATDEESADAMQDFIKAAIKSKMDDGDFDNVSPEVARVSYTEISKHVDGSETTDQDNSQVGNNGTGVLVGALVAAGVVVAAIGTIVYKRRHRDHDAGSTYFGDQPTLS